MSDTTYVDYIAPAVSAEWLNEINDHVWHDTPVSGTMIHDASVIKNTPSGTISSTNTQAAIDEIVSDLAATSGASLVGFVQAKAGAIARTVQNKISEAISITDFAGCDPTGATNSNAAFLSALKSNSDVFIPPGIYLLNPLTLTGIDSLKIHGVPGFGTQIICNTNNATAITFISSTNIVIEDVAFTTTSVPTLCRGLTIQNSSNLSINRCLFYNFTDSAIQYKGTALEGLSGNSIQNSLFLGNMGALGQVFGTYCMDYWFLNNQFGYYGSNIPLYGLWLDHSSNGTVSNNYLWRNVVGFIHTASEYSRIYGNRFEESEQVGASFQQCNAVNFFGNWLNANGRAAPNTYDSIAVSNCTVMQISGNQVFDWGFPAASCRFGININTNSSSITIKGNRINGYGTSPVAFDSTETTANVSFDSVLSSASSATVAASTTVYLGANGHQATEVATLFIAPTGGIVARINAAVVAAPGAGQTYTYTLMVNGVATSMAFSITGAATFSGASCNNPVLINQGDSVTLRLTTSAGATATYHRCQISMIDI